MLHSIGQTNEQRVFTNSITSPNCRRWYFTFNAVECSAPEVIDGIVYMENGNKSGAQRNLYRVRQIEGVCEKVHKGTVRVAFWVGNCAG